MTTLLRAATAALLLLGLNAMAQAGEGSTGTLEARLTPAEATMPKPRAAAAAPVERAPDAPLSRAYETMFAGYPADTTQIGLRELEPTLFTNDRLSREEGCMAAALYFEARGESEEGQLAVAQVILNRVDANAYPDTVCEVVWQNSHRRNACQFSFTCDGKADRPSEKRRWASIVRLARNIMQGTWSEWAAKPTQRLASAVQAATHYHADYVSPSWAPRLKKARKIGRHIFYISDRVARTIRRT